MPKKEYRHTEYARAAKKRSKEKVLRVRFELNVSQTEMARELDPEAYGATSIHTLAKKIFLEHFENNKKEEIG